MSDNIASSKPVKHTVIWPLVDWERIEKAATQVSEETHAEIEVPNFIRGAVMRRVNEILGEQEAAA